jgi:hypothetical protein
VAGEEKQTKTAFGPAPFAREPLPEARLYGALVKTQNKNLSIIYLN